MRTHHHSAQHTRDLTQGSVVRSLLLFALPLLGSSLIQQLYSSVDLFFVGNLIGKEAAAAVGSGSLLISCLIDFFVGLGVGINILCAHAFGSGDESYLKKLLHTSILFAVCASVLLTLLGWWLTPAVLRWYNTPDSIFPMASTYMRIYFLGLTAIINFNIGSGILRAVGDSRSPMLCQILGGMTNIVGDFVFIYILKLGVAGAALATILSQTAAMLLVGRMLCCLPDNFRLRFRELHFHSDAFRRILVIGLPTAIQAMIVTFSNLVMQTQINQLGVDSIAAFTAFYKVDALAYLPLVSLGQAMVTFSAQNLGGGKPERLRKGLFSALGIGFAIAFFIGGAISFLYQPFYRLFSTDPAVIAIGGAIGHSAFLYYLLYSYSDTMSAVLRGSGRTFSCMLLSFISIVVLRFPVIFLLFDTYHSAAGMALVYPITWSVACVCTTIYYLICRRNIYTPRTDRL